MGPPGSNNLQIFVNAGPKANLNAPLNLEYNAFIHCPSRCFTTAALNATHNYFEGVNMYDSTAFAAHGDGWLTAFYNGPIGPPGQRICNCAGINSLVEKFDTWVMPNVGAGATSCLTCAIVNLPAGSMAGTSRAGSNILHVTAVHMNFKGTYPSVGMPINGIHPFDSLLHASSAGTGARNCCVPQQHVRWIAWRLYSERSLDGDLQSQLRLGSYISSVCGYSRL